MKKISGFFKRLGSLLSPLANILRSLTYVVWDLLKSFGRLFKKGMHWRNLIHYDNIFATGTLILFLWLISEINFEVINPIGDAFNDVELTDLAFSKMGRNSNLRIGDYDGRLKENKHITIVNIGLQPRHILQEVLAKVNSYNPRVVAFDVNFRDNKGFLDNLLADEFKKTKNLVLVSELKKTDSLKSLPNEETQRQFDTILTSLPKFSKNATYGFANMVTNKSESFKSGTVTREFLTRAYDFETKDTLYPWAVEVVRKYKPEALKKLFTRDNDKEIIDYVGNVFVRNQLLPAGYNKNIKWKKRHFEAIEYKTLLDIVNKVDTTVSLDSSIFKDRIVLFGYMGERMDLEETGEDLFYSPLNERYIGKTPQDMYGVVVHANIIDQILRGTYIDESNEFVMNVIGLLITYLVFAFYRPIYDDHKVWYDGLTKFLGILTSLIILGFIGMVFEYLNFKIVFGAIWFGCILLAGDWLEIYYGLGKNLYSKIKHTVKT